MHESYSRPIFIVGTERSGSNLLRLILNAHPRIAVPHPPHILRFLSPLERDYDNRLERLIDDVLMLARWHILPWQRYPTSQQIESLLRSRDLVGVYGALYEWFARQEQKPRWGCKSTFVIHSVDKLLARYPAAQFIWLIRDPRDVAASSKSSVFNPLSPLLVARLWARQQGIGLRYAQKLSRSQWHTLRYESLVSEPEAQLRQICGFLGEPYADSMLGFSSSREAQEMARQSASWRHVDSSIFCTSIGRHRVKLTRREITEVESVAGKLMARLGYEPSCQAARVTMPRNFVVYLLEAVRRVMIEISAVFSDCNFWRRWRRAGYLVWLHLTRSQLLSFRPRRITARENRSDP